MTPKQPLLISVGPRPWICLLRFAVHASPLLDDNPTGEPIVRLEFPGPGDAPHLPAGSDAALAAQHSGALVFASPVPNEQVVITPPLDNPRLRFISLMLCQAPIFPLRVRQT